MNRRLWIVWIYGLLALGWSSAATPAWAQGSIVTAAGPVNRSMAGAAVASPIDSAGAIFWNPASMAGLEKSDMTYSAAMYYGTTRLSSVVPAGSLAPGFPPATLGGTSRSDGGVGTLPTAALFYKSPESKWSFGFGAFAAGGFSSNYPASPVNPIVSPRPPNGVAAGPIFTGAGFGQFVGAMSYQVAPHLAIGFGPTITSVMIQADPAGFAFPDDANGDGLATSPTGTHTRMYWGLGFSAGIYGFLDNGWHFGASIKSKQWMQTISYHAADELGFPRRLNLDVDFPMILSVGISYMGLEKWVFAVDVRWVDFKHTAGIGNPAGLDATGRVTGPGLESAFGVSAGVQYRLSETMSFRLGYFWAENPVPDEAAFFNSGGSAIYNHVLYLGMSYHLTETLKLSMTYVQVFPNAIEGPFFTPAGPVPGSMVRIDQRAELIDFGFTVNY